MRSFTSLPDMGKDYVKADYAENYLVIRSEEKEIDLVFELDRQILFNSENVNIYKVDDSIITLFNDTDYEQTAAHVMGDKLVYLNKYATVKNWFVTSFELFSDDMWKHVGENYPEYDIDIEILVNNLVKAMPELGKESEDLKRTLSYLDTWQINKDIFRSIDNYSKGEEVIKKFGNILVANLYYNIYLPLKKE